MRRVFEGFGKEDFLPVSQSGELRREARHAGKVQERPSIGSERLVVRHVGLQIRPRSILQTLLPPKRRDRDDQGQECALQGALRSVRRRAFLGFGCGRGRLGPPQHEPHQRRREVGAVSQAPGQLQLGKAGQPGRFSRDVLEELPSQRLRKGMGHRLRQDFENVRPLRALFGNLRRLS
jgi:hypothetical protein